MKICWVISLVASGLGLAQSILLTSQCDPISKYTPEWFLANTKEEWKLKSLDSTALFYTAGLSQQAKHFARQAGNQKTTIWDLWPCENYNIKGTRGNPLSCIMADAAQELKYFENMSAAFAMKAAKVAAVMHRDINNPPMSTIWGRIEFPILQAWGAVDYVTAIDAKDVGKRKLEWWRNFSEMLRDQTHPAVQKILHGRDADGEDLEERAEVDACPLIIDSSHPLW